MSAAAMCDWCKTAKAVDAFSAYAYPPQHAALPKGWVRLAVGTYPSESSALLEGEFCSLACASLKLQEFVRADNASRTGALTCP